MGTTISAFRSSNDLSRGADFLKTNSNPKEGLAKSGGSKGSGREEKLDED